MSRVMVAGVLVLGFLVAVPKSAHASGAELRLGAFAPSADSQFFDDDDDLYATRDKDWRGLTGGGEFSFDLGPNVELGLHIDGYGRELSTSYREFTHENGDDIRQHLKLSIIPMGASLRILPAGKRAAISPYLAAGVDVVAYKYEEFGTSSTSGATATSGTTRSWTKEPPSASMRPQACGCVSTTTSASRARCAISTRRPTWARTSMGIASTWAGSAPRWA